MKKFFGALVLTCLLAGGAGIKGACADEGAEPKTLLGDMGFAVSGDINLSTIYMWRGIMLDGDPVAQPGVYVTSPELKLGDASLGKLKLGFWGSMPLEDKDALKSAEQDYIVDWTYGLEQLAFSVGHIYYFFPDAAPTDGSLEGWSREVYAGVAFSKLPLAPSVFFYYDYGKKADGGGEGTYTVLNLAQSIPFSVGDYSLSLDLNGHVGHNNKQYYRGKGGEAGLGAGVTVPLTKTFSCKPNVNYVAPWGNISDKGNGNQKNRFFYGVYFSAAF